MSSPGLGQWVVAPDGTRAWQQPDGSLWRQAPDGGWVAVASPPPGVPATAAARRRPDAAGFTLLAALVAGGVGVLLPWVSVVFASATGLDTADGKAYGGVVVAALVFFGLRFRTRRLAFGVLALIACLALAAIAIYDVVDVANTPDGPFGISVKPGSGLYLDLVAGIVASVASAVALRSDRGPVPDRSRRRPSRRAVVLACALVTALVAGLIAIAVVAGSSSEGPGPGATVKDYLAALADGNAAKALALGPTPPSRAFLTDDILDKQQSEARIRDVTVGDADGYGNDASVPVTYNFGSKSVDTDFSLRKTGGRWRLTATTVSIDVGDLPSVPGVTLFGKPVTESTIQVFPGPLQFASADPDFAVTDESAGDFATSPDDFADANLDTELSSAGKQKVDAAVRAFLATCARADTLEPDGCPQSAFAPGDVVRGSVSWKLTGDPKPVNYQLDSERPTLVDVSGQVEFSVTYRYKDWDDSVHHGHDTTSGYIDGNVDLSAGTPVLTPS